MDFSIRNKKVAIARWRKVLEAEKSIIPSDDGMVTTIICPRIRLLSC